MIGRGPAPPVRVWAPSLAGAAVLLVATLLPWYSLQLQGRPERWNAWQVFSKLDALFVLSALAVIALSFVPGRLSALLRWGIGGLGLLMVAWKVIDPPAYEAAAPLAGPYVAIAGTSAIIAAAVVDLHGPAVAGPTLRLPRAAGWIAAGVVLVALAAVGYGGWVQDGGFDQVGYAQAAWIHNDSDGSLGGAMDVLGHLDYRPGAKPYIATLHVVLGRDPGGHVAWAVLLALASALLLFAALRKLRVPLVYALLAAAILLVFPPTDSTRFGTTLSIASWTISLWLAGLLIAFHGIWVGGRRGAAWHVVALALYFVSVVTYEIAAGAIGLSFLAYALYARAWRPALLRWPADLAVVALPAIFIILKNTKQTTQSSSGVVDHARQILSEGSSVMGWSLWPSDIVNGHHVVIVAALVVLAGVLAMVLLPRAVALRRALADALLLGAGGLLLLGAGYAPFVPAGSYYSPLQIGDGNRTNALAAAGFSLVVVCMLAVAALLACAPLRRPWVATAVAVLAGVVLIAGPYTDRLHETKDLRVQAHVLQRQLAGTVARSVPKHSGRWTVYAFQVPAYTGDGVPVFNTTWDMPGAVGLARSASDLTTYPIAATEVRCEPHQATMVRYGLSTAYGPRLLFVDAVRGTKVVVDRAARCRAAQLRMRPGALNAIG